MSLGEAAGRLLKLRQRQRRAEAIEACALLLGDGGRRSSRRPWGAPFSTSRSSRRRRRVMLAPPMCLDLRYSFEGIILGFASGSKRCWRSTISLKAMTDCPEVSALSLGVRLDPDRERRSLIGYDWEYRAGNAGNRRCSALAFLAVSRVRSAQTRMFRCVATSNYIRVCYMMSQQVTFCGPPDGPPTPCRT